MCVYIIISLYIKYIFDIYFGLVVKLVLLQRMEEVCWSIGLGGIGLRTRMWSGLGSNRVLWCVFSNTLSNCLCVFIWKFCCCEFRSQAGFS